MSCPSPKLRLTRRRNRLASGLEQLLLLPKRWRSVCAVCLLVIGIMLFAGSATPFPSTIVQPNLFSLVFLGGILATVALLLYADRKRD